MVCGMCVMLVCGNDPQDGMFERVLCWCVLEVCRCVGALCVGGLSV